MRGSKLPRVLAISADRRFLREIRLALPLGARILCALQDFAEAYAGRRDPAVAMESLKLKAHRYDPHVLEALEEVLATHSSSSLEGCVPVMIQGLSEGMVLGRPLCTHRGHQVFPAGTRLGRPHLQLIRDAAVLLDLLEPAFVLGG